MDRLHGFVIGLLHDAYVLRVSINGAYAQLNHRPADAAERHTLQTGLELSLPVVVELGGARPVRVRSENEVPAPPSTPPPRRQPRRP